MPPRYPHFSLSYTRPICLTIGMLSDAAPPAPHADGLYRVQRSRSALHHPFLVIPATAMASLIRDNKQLWRVIPDHVRDDDGVGVRRAAHKATKDTVSLKPAVSFVSLSRQRPAIRPHHNFIGRRKRWGRSVNFVNFGPLPRATSMCKKLEISVNPSAGSGRALLNFGRRSAPMCSPAILKPRTRT